MNETKDQSSQSNLNNQYRQPETVQLAPDALVFINGSNVIQGSDGQPVDIRQDITEINVSLSTESTPGTANFTISYPSTSGGRAGIKKYKNLVIMSEITIYFKGRFLKKTSDDPNATSFYPYYQAFWGLISSISENYNDGVNTISVSCSDILRWWQITNIVINPSLLSTTENLTTYLEKNFNLKEPEVNAFLKGLVTKDNSGRPISIFGNVFANKTIPEILQTCSSISLLQMAPIHDYLGASSQAVSVDKTIREKMVDPLTGLATQMNYWRDRLLQVGRNLKIYALTTKTIDNQEGRLDIDMTRVVAFSPLDLAAIESQKLGNSTIVYQIVPTSISGTAKSERKSQLEIINEVKEAIHFEFFMDVNGEIVLKPPFYNLDVKQNAPNSIINDVDITSWNFVQSESEVVTRMDVNGTMAGVTHYGETTNGIAFDPLLTLQFGERPQQRSMGWLHTQQQCKFWAAAELGRQNALIRQGTISIIGRPELRLGYPVYVPSRDAYYYIKGIEHRFTFGGSFSTTLTVCAERRNTNTKLGIFKNIGEITDSQISVVGGSVSQPNTLNNFVKQTYMPNICTPRATESEKIVEPNFVIDMTSRDSGVQGLWAQDSGRTINNSPKEFQTSDTNGYEIIGTIGDPPYIAYGLDDKFDKDSAIQTIDIATGLTTQAEANAAKALILNPVTNQLSVSPNNTILTLSDSVQNMNDNTGVSPLNMAPLNSNAPLSSYLSTQ